MKITICRDAFGFYIREFIFDEEFDVDKFIRKMLRAHHIPLIKEGEELTVDLFFANPKVKRVKKEKE